MTAKPVHLPSIKFATQSEANIFFRGVLRHYAPGDRVAVPQWDRYLRELLARHPEVDEKVGCGVSHFTVEKNPPWGSTGFRIHRIDGTEADFSLKVCIAAKPLPHRQQIHKALRRVVLDDVRRFRDDTFRGRSKVPCAVTGRLLTRDEGHIDHRPPKTFEWLVDDFLAAEGLTYEDVKLSPPTDVQPYYDLADTTIRLSFVIYHNLMAELRFVAIDVNLAKDPYEALL